MFDNIMKQIEELNAKIDSLSANKELTTAGSFEALKADNQKLADAVANTKTEFEEVKAANLELQKTVRQFSVEKLEAQALTRVAQVETELVTAEKARMELEETWKKSLSDNGIDASNSVIAKRISSLADQTSFDEYSQELNFVMGLGKGSAVNAERKAMEANQEQVLASDGTKQELKTGTESTAQRGQTLGKVLVAASKEAMKSRK